MSEWTAPRCVSDGHVEAEPFVTALRRSVHNGELFIYEGRIGHEPLSTPPRAHTCRRQYDRSYKKPHDPHLLANHHGAAGSGASTCDASTCGWDGKG